MNATRDRHRLAVSLWVLGGTFLVGMFLGHDTFLARDFRPATSSSSEDVFQTTSPTAATAFWLALLALGFICVVLGLRYVLLRQSTWRSGAIWLTSMVVATIVLIGGLAVLSLVPVGHELIIDGAHAQVVISDRYLLRSSSRVVSLEHIAKIEYEVWGADGESGHCANVSVVDVTGRARKLSTGDLEGQRAIASQLAARTPEAELRVTHPREDDGEIIATCQL